MEVVALTFYFLAWTEEFLKEKSPGADAPRLALAAFCVFCGSNSSCDFVVGDGRAVVLTFCFFARREDFSWEGEAPAEP